MHDSVSHLPQPFLHAEVKSLSPPLRLVAPDCVVAEATAHLHLLLQRELHQSRADVSARIRTEGTISPKSPCCFPTSKIIDACKMSENVLSSCRRLCELQTDRQPASALVAWNRWCVFYLSHNLSRARKGIFFYFFNFSFQKEGRDLLTRCTLYP